MNSPMSRGSSSTVTSSFKFKLYLATAGFGLAAGLIAALATSAIILLAEKVTSLPVGTFYIVLSSAIFQTQSQATFYSIELGFLMHILVGALIGLVISSILFFGVSRKSLQMHAPNIIKYAPVYGLVAGFVIWIGLFIPITFGIMLPLLNSHQGNNIIKEQTSAGVFSIAKDRLLSMMNQVIVSSLVFHLFYGLLTIILTRSMYETYLQKKERSLLR